MAYILTVQHEHNPLASIYLILRVMKSPEAEKVSTLRILVVKETFLLLPNQWAALSFRALLLIAIVVIQSFDSVGA